MRVFKKVMKIIGILFLVAVLLVTAADAYLILKPEFESKKVIEGIENYALDVDDLTISDDVCLIGLGEASHGNKEFQELKLDVLKNLVENSSVRVVGFEMEYGEGCFINDYINNNSNLDIEEIFEEISFGIYHTEQIKELIEWMKEYNTKNDDKLSFFGFDNQNPGIALEYIVSVCEDNNIMSNIDMTNINAYIEGDLSLRSENANDLFTELDAIKEEIDENYDKYEDVFDYDRIMGCIESVSLAKNLSDNGSDIIKYGEVRDTQMANNILEALKSALANQTKVIVFGHNGHVGYAGSYVTTMGKHLKDTLGDEYYVIGTDYYKTTCNISNGSGGRGNHYFVSADILAYQAKELGTYLLNFKDVDENSEVGNYVYKPIYTGSLGESYSILNKVMADSVRIYCEPNYLYDSMIFVYEATPLELLKD